MRFLSFKRAALKTSTRTGLGKTQVRCCYMVGVQLGTGNNFWSSSEYNNNNARNVNTNNGNVNNNNKNNNNRVRAFLRL